MTMPSSNQFCRPILPVFLPLGQLPPPLKIPFTSPFMSDVLHSSSLAFLMPGYFKLRRKSDRSVCNHCEKQWVQVRYHHKHTGTVL